MTMTDQEAAARCLEDPAFARAVVQGESYPRVREAILADLQAAHEVEGFLNPQPLPPRELQAFVLGINPAWSQWTGRAFTHLARLAGGLGVERGPAI